MKASLSIKILNLENYNKTNLCIYQKFVEKLIYLLYGIKSDIAYIVGQLSKYNANLKKRYFQVAK